MWSTLVVANVDLIESGLTIFKNFSSMIPKFAGERVSKVFIKRLMQLLLTKHLGKCSFLLSGGHVAKFGKNVGLKLMMNPKRL